MPPCKGCGIRAEGCHAICMRYAAYRAELEEKREKRKQALTRDWAAGLNRKKLSSKFVKDAIKRRQRGSGQT